MLQNNNAKLTKTHEALFAVPRVLIMKKLLFNNLMLLYLSRKPVDVLP